MRTEELTAKILENNPNMDRYQLAIIVSTRADELLNGAQSKINVIKNAKASDIALMELAEGLLVIDRFEDIQK